MGEAITIARPYAQAAFNVAKADGALVDWAEALENCAAIADHPAFLAVYGDPALGKSDIVALLLAWDNSKSKLAQEVVSGVRNLVVQLVMNKRALFFGAVLQEFSDLVLAAEHKKRVFITSAIELSTAQKQRVVAYLQTKVAETLIPLWEVDPRLVGGFKAKVGATVYNLSVEHTCQMCEQQLTITD